MIDHLVVTPRGVVMIDTKRHGGFVDVGRKRLCVGGRNATQMVHSAHAQAAAVRQIVGPGVPVRGWIRFVEGDLTLVGNDWCDGVRVCGLDGLRRHLETLDHSSAAIDVHGVAAHLDAVLAPAVASH